MARTILSGFALVVLGYAVVCLLVFFFQRRLVYFPGPPSQITPASAGLAFRELPVVGPGGERLHAWLLPAAESAARDTSASRPGGTVLVCHGNAGTIASRLHLAEAFLELGLSVVLFDYAGYGWSEGTPSEEGSYRDAVAVFDHLITETGLAPEQVAVFGESLGAAVAIELARRRPVAGLVLESAFTSVPDMGAKTYPFLPVRLLARIRYDNLAKIVELDLPMLFVHSPRDEIVPVAYGRALFEAASGRRAAGDGAPTVEFLETTGGHNDGGFLLREEWRQRVGSFLERCVSSKSG